MLMYYVFIYDYLSLFMIICDNEMIINDYFLLFVIICNYIFDYFWLLYQIFLCLFNYML